MEKHIDVMKRSIELSETVLEGLAHIQHLFSEGKMEQTVYLFEDVLIALATIKQTTDPILQSLQSEVSSDLFKRAELIVTAYEEKNYPKVQEVLQFSFVPQCEKYQAQLTAVFQPYLVS